MVSEGAREPARVTCPGCGDSAAARAVPEICADPASVPDGLADRLARQPDAASRGDSWLHFAEGLLMAGVGAALAYSGIQSDEPLYTIGGSLLAVLLFAGTVLVVRGEARGRRVVEAGEERASELWRPASYCSACGTVFFPGGDPWEGPLTPEQFQKFVWTEAGYGKHLDTELKDVALPPGIPVRAGGSPDHA
ncbi:hypothetical protein ACFS5L_38115 [Streptomyces phyllanthi]|uniref:Uncharacterized protein n=1 Tax=Streptomyces phyllanthi TaxID=1803180 RepID=A0A5N8W2Q4_9ACTN|nr:hypothetical protein [Streptomyces phyllanthi]MPY41767.1 hypothetical protein [Streptomyces phyllanthi]